MGRKPETPTTAIATDSEPERIRSFRLVSLEGPEAAWRASEGRLTLGSLPGNDVVLDDPTVSRFHCELSAAPGGVWLTDLDSRNGSRIDGIRVKQAMVTHGNVLRLGHTSLRFERLAERETIEVSASSAFGALVGSSRPMRALFATLERSARSDGTVLLEGETGTGKGAVAEAIHNASARAGAPLVVVDCAALAASLLESELFGHEKGAFTGAEARRIGAFEEASGGTIFLDEIGELPAEMQPKLLRVLENRVVRPLGQNSYRPVDVRVIAATHRDLRKLVNEGGFRADLYYRLAVVRVRIPPLRERAADMPELAAALLHGLGASPAQVAALTRTDVIERLQRSAWPGNVRELRNHLESSLILESALPMEVQGESESHLALPEARRLAVDAFERRYLEDLLRRHGKVSAAAKAAGVARVYLYRLLAKHGMKPQTD